MLLGLLPRDVDGQAFQDLEVLLKEKERVWRAERHMAARQAAWLACHIGLAVQWGIGRAFGEKDKPWKFDAVVRTVPGYSKEFEPKKRRGRR